MKAAIFDLFGTLVPSFNRLAHTAAIHKVADILGLEFEGVHGKWVQSYSGRVSGRFSTIAENIDWIQDELKAPKDALARDAAAAEYFHFTTASVSPLDGVISSLYELRNRGFRLGLLTNCAPDVSRAIAESDFRGLFHAEAYSCAIGAAKPSPSAYMAVLDLLDVRSSEALYVGDGSDSELPGAAAVGLIPLLVPTDLNAAYDQDSRNLDAWKGRRIDSIQSLLDEPECQ